MSGRLGDKARLYHILDAIEEIESYIGDVSKDEFWANSMMYNATLRQLEIIGEASNNLTDQLRINNPQIPWSRIIRLRNIVVHEYFGIDDMMIWNILKINIPDLKHNINALVDSLPI